MTDTQVLDRSLSNGAVDDAYPFSAFEAWCRANGKFPPRLHLAELGDARTRGKLSQSLAEEWAYQLEVEIEDIWPRDMSRAIEVDDARSRGLPRSSENEVPAQLASGPSNLRGIPRNRAEEAKRKADCTLAISKACEQWSEAFDHLMVIARHDETGIGVEGELQQEYRILRKALRDVEAWYGSLTYAEVLAQLVLSGKADTPEINLTGGEQ